MKFSSAIASLLATGMVTAVSATTHYQCSFDVEYVFSDNHKNPRYPSKGQRKWMMQTMQSTYEDVHAGSDYHITSVKAGSFEIKKRSQVADGEEQSTNLRVVGTQQAGEYSVTGHGSGGVRCTLCGSGDDDDDAAAITSAVDMERLYQNLGGSDKHKAWVENFCIAMRDGPHKIFHGAHHCDITRFNCKEKAWDEDMEKLLANPMLAITDDADADEFDIF